MAVSKRVHKPAAAKKPAAAVKKAAKKVAKKKETSKPAKKASLKKAAKPAPPKGKPVKAVLQRDSSALKNIEAAPAAIYSRDAADLTVKSEADALFESLPLKQQTFIGEYLGNGFNATNAAKSAGFSAKTADSQGSRLLKNDKVAKVIAARSEKQLEKLEITAERVLEQIGRLAFFDVRKLYDDRGELLPVGALGDVEAAAIAGLEVKELTMDGCPIGSLKKIKLTDRTKSLEMLGRYFRMFTERVEHSGVLGVQLIHDIPRPQRKKD